MHTFTSKSGDRVVTRCLNLTDTQIMLDFINEIGMEDIYVNVNPDDLYTYDQEKKYIQDTINKIKKNLTIQYLAFINSQLIGTAGVSRLDKRRKHIGIFGITIAKKYRSDGIGVQLSEYTISQAKELLGVSKIILTSFQKNQPALNLYQKLGFVQYGSLEKSLLYKDKYETEILLYKDL